MRKTNKNFLMAGAFIMSLLPMIAGAAGTTPEGLWQAFNDQGKLTGYIRVTEHQGIYRGVVEKGLPTDTADKKCTACKDYRKDQPMLGMEIFAGVRRNGEVFDGGEILEPFSGNVYRVKIEMQESGNIMKVRGYQGVSLFGRTQYWRREE